MSKVPLYPYGPSPFRVRAAPVPVPGLRDPCRVTVAGHFDLGGEALVAQHVYPVCVLVMNTFPGVPRSQETATP